MYARPSRIDELYQHYSRCWSDDAYMRELTSAVRPWIRTTGGYGEDNWRFGKLIYSTDSYTLDENDGYNPANDVPDYPRYPEGMTQRPSIHHGWVFGSFDDE